MTRDEILDELADAEYGADASVTLDDGRSLRARVVPDDCDAFAEINGSEAWGRVAWVQTDRCTGHDRPRPDGFDGDAMKLQTMRGDRFWWQPLLDVWGTPREQWTAEVRRQEADKIEELVTFGFKVVILELCDADRDAYGRAIVREVATLCGIDSLENGYLRTVLAELMDELAVVTS